MSRGTHRIPRQDREKEEDRSPTVGRPGAAPRELIRPETARELLATLGERGERAFRAAYQQESGLLPSFREFAKAYNQGLRGEPKTAVEPGRSIDTMAGCCAGQNDAAAQSAAPLQTQKTAPTREAGTGLVPLTEQDEVRLSTGKNNIIARTFQDIVSFVKRARSKKGGSERLYMGTIPDSAAELIRSKTGINVFGYTAILPGDSVQHIFKNHGTASTENSRGQRAVTENDIALIPEVLSSPDRVSLSQDTDVLGRSVLLLEKQIGDTYVTAQAVTDGRHALTTNSLWIQKKKNRPTIPDAGMTPSPEGNARSALSQGSSGTIIPKDGQEVNPENSGQIDEPAAVEQGQSINFPQEETITKESRYKHPYGHAARTCHESGCRICS